LTCTCVPKHTTCAGSVSSAQAWSQVGSLITGGIGSVSMAASRCVRGGQLGSRTPGLARRAHPLVTTGTSTGSEYLAVTPVRLVGATVCGSWEDQWRGHTAR
jgi:hypothetical protein